MTNSVGMTPDPSEPQLVRATLVKTASQQGLLFSPTITPTQVDIGDSWSFALAAGRRIPVVCRQDDIHKFTLLDNPQSAVPAAIAVPGVQSGHSGVEILDPSETELSCPAPTVPAYREELASGSPHHLPEPPDSLTMQAFVLRVDQLSRHELNRIVRLAQREVTAELIDQVREIGPGLEYSASSAADAFRRFQTADLWPEKVINATYVAIAHIAAAHEERAGLVWRRLAQRLATQSTADVVSTMLRPWVTVCGPVPGATIEPLSDPDAPYRPRNEPPASTIAIPRPSRRPSPSTPRRPARPARPAATQAPSSPAGRPAAGPGAQSGRRSTGRWWQRLAGRVADRPSPTIDHGDRGSNGATTPAAAPHDTAEGATPQLLWAAGVEKHDGVLGDYAQYEIDPQMILTYPAASDVQVPQTRTFHNANERASALRTESGPADTKHAEAYFQAVTALERAWTAAKSHARQIGRDYLDDDEADDLRRAAGLIRHAAATSGPESESYRQAAGRLLGAHPRSARTSRARQSLDRAVRGEIAAAQDGPRPAQPAADRPASGRDV